MVQLYYEPVDTIRSQAGWWALGFFGIGVATMFFVSLQSWMFAIAGGHLTERLRRMTFQVRFLCNIILKELGNITK